MFQKISVSEKFDGYEGGGEYQDFPSKSLCLTVPKIFVGEFFSVSLTLGIEKKLGIRERERERERERRDYDFLSLLLCLTVTKRFVEEPFGVSESFGYRKILCLRGEYHDFR